MKAHITSEEQAIAELQAYMSAKLKEASLNGFMLGGSAAMKMAVDRYGEDIRNSTTFEELQKHSFVLLSYLENKAQGLKDISEDKKDG